MQRFGGLADAEQGGVGGDGVQVGAVEDGAADVLDPAGEDVGGGDPAVGEGARRSSFAMVACSWGYRTPRPKSTT
ncbi:MAG: hypothetical protein ACRDNL_11790 [Spirillospora sp.]